MLDSQITFEAARMNAGLTLKEVARRLNVNARTVKRWEAYKASRFRQTVCRRTLALWLPIRLQPLPPLSWKTTRFM